MNCVDAGHFLYTDFAVWEMKEGCYLHVRGRECLVPIADGIDLMMLTES